MMEVAGTHEPKITSHHRFRSLKYHEACERSALSVPWSGLIPISLMPVVFAYLPLSLSRSHTHSLYISLLLYIFLSLSVLYIFKLIQSALCDRRCFGYFYVVKCRRKCVYLLWTEVQHGGPETAMYCNLIKLEKYAHYLEHALQKYEEANTMRERETERERERESPPIGHTTPAGVL